MISLRSEGVGGVMFVLEEWRCWLVGGLWFTLNIDGLPWSSAQTLIKATEDETYNALVF